MSKSPSAAIRHFPLVSKLWPGHEAVGAELLRAVILIAAGTALLALSAKVNLPLPYVPMTLQTLVVLMLGAAYGWRLGCATVIAYLAEGAMGLPVFAGPVGGLAPLVGPTSGYLFGFVAAAFVAGWLSERGWDRSMAFLFAAMMIGHVIILAAGFAWLAYGIGLGCGKAWMVGVLPFIACSVVKSALEQRCCRQPGVLSTSVFGRDSSPVTIDSQRRSLLARCDVLPPTKV